MDSSLFVLTFGVELEFIAFYNPGDYEDKRLESEGKLWTENWNLSLQQKYGLLVRIDMIDMLNEHGFPTNGYEDTDFSKWTVDTDASVTSVETSGNWYAIELKTPVLRSCKASLDLIDRAVKLLVSKFKLFTNEKCGLHVHVGNENRGFDMHTLKNFCSLITAFDRQLESLHHPSRIENPYAKSTRKAFSRGTTLAEKLSIIDQLETLEDLVVRFHFTEDGDGDKHMAYNLFNLQFHHLMHATLAEPLRTIEFRQHRGTLDPDLITNWIKVVCGLVENSYRDKGNFRRLFDKLQAHDSVYTVVNLFEDLQLGKQAEFYAPLVHQYEVDRNPAAVDNFMVDGEPVFIDNSFPGQYDTPWEKEFAPRPPSESSELISYLKSLYADINLNHTEYQADLDNANRDNQPGFKSEEYIWPPIALTSSEPDHDEVSW